MPWLPLRRIINTSRRGPPTYFVAQSFAPSQNLPTLHAVSYGNMTGPPTSSDKDMKEKIKADKAAEKAAKFAAKQAKQKQQQNQNQTKSKPKAEATPALPPFRNETPVGEKKPIHSFNDPHFSAYNPSAVEAAWYQWWEKSGFFKPEASTQAPDAAGSFVIPLPPPNVTGSLHCGHALANSLQDTLIRWHRMKGYTTLWVPGCDHAGISTQSVVEKMLWKKEHKTRVELGREKFVETVWDWKNDYHQRINNAQRLMGGSMDWSREAFTMDKNLSAATSETFCRLFEEGLIYRSSRLVLWCTALNTALSTLEVENKEITGKTMLSVPGYDKKIAFGLLTHFRYEIEGSEETIEVATTRPETMLGDSGVAVHPDDKRYQHLIGKYARHPFVDRRLKIVADAKFVDPEFGTGAVKLTPAHDPNDYQMGKTHGLEFVNILNDDGTLNDNAGSFKGQRRFDARYTVVEELKSRGLYVKEENNPMKIPLCEKSKDVIEPVIKPQWWMEMQGMADAALKVVESGEVKISPESANRSYRRWMSSINDWCISRQLWWGHQIPAYRVVFEGEDEAEGDSSSWVVGRSAEEAEEKAAARFGDKKFRLERDPDCLDTWFSSGLWPMSTLGWPNVENPDFKKFFPTSLLETGWDILFFWVARMIMLSVKLTGKVPFTEVYCHSLIRDSEGRKMSKSLGNVIDPLDIINGIALDDLHAKLYVGNLKDDEVAKATKYQKTAFPGGIPECGADALRFTLLSYTTGGGDISFDIKVMHAYRRFCNKIWQASKYVLGKLPEDFAPVAKLDLSKLSVPEKWILHRMNVAVKGMNEALAAREFSRCAQYAYQFFYDELCDIFIENSKSILSDGTPEAQASAQQTLYHTIDVALRLMHPIMPFITEELWQRLPKSSEVTTQTIMLASYPEYDTTLEFAVAAKDYELGLSSAQGLRSLTSEYGVRSDGHAYVKASTAETYSNINAQLSAIKTLSGKGIAEVQSVGPEGGEDAIPSGCAVYVLASDLAVYLELGSRLTNVDAEIKKVQGKIQKSQLAAKKQEELLARDGFEDKVSEVVFASERKKLADAKAAVENYEKTIEQFEKLKVSSA